MDRIYQHFWNLPEKIPKKSGSGPGVTDAGLLTGIPTVTVIVLYIWGQRYEPKIVLWALEESVNVGVKKLTDLTARISTPVPGQKMDFMLNLIA